MPTNPAESPGRLLRCALSGAALFLALQLAGCGSSAPTAEPYSAPTDGFHATRPDMSHVPDAVPRVEPRSRYGNPRSYVVRGKRYHTLPSAGGYRERGIASWYGRKFHGRRTSSGEPYDMYAMTAAHKELPLPAYARVTNLNNGRSVVVRVNDRGPFHENRIIDLSYTAAFRLGMLDKGTALVEVEAIDPAHPRGAQPARRVARADHDGNPRIFLQAGAFGSRRNAENLRADLERGLQRAVQIRNASNRGRLFYRVQVGPLPSVERADKVALEMQALGVVKPVVVLE